MEDANTVIYTDGSCLGNPGPGGWGWFVSEDLWAAGGELETTNNRMELQAVLEALRAFQGPLTVISDSKYVIDAVTKWRHGWKRKNWKKADGKPVANQDLMIAIDDAMRANVTFQWVKGHSGHPGNEAVDDIARSVAEDLKNGHTPVTGP